MYSTYTSYQNNISESLLACALLTRLTEVCLFCPPPLALSPHKLPLLVQSPTCTPLPPPLNPLLFFDSLGTHSSDTTTLMACYTITEDAYEAWKRHLPADCTARASLDELESHFTAGPPPAKPHTAEAWTQLLTVSTISLSANVLARVKARIDAAALYATVGRLAALTSVLCADLGVLLDLAVLGTVTAATLAAAHGMDTAHSPSPPHDRDALPSCDAMTSELLDHLSAPSVEALCATSKAFRQQRATGGDEPPVSAGTFLGGRLAARVAQAQAQLDQRRLLEHFSVGAGAGPTFLCARCRQDGRFRPQTEAEQRQLSHARLKNSPPPPGRR